MTLRRDRIWQICGLVGAIASLNHPVLAQVVEDNTLGAENSQVIRNVQIRGVDSDRIEGGARRGQNLFHSFQQFSVQEGRGTYFLNPDGVRNIIGRITGGGRSDIFGRLGVISPDNATLGAANLFLINPNGIVFGANSSLDVAGSFVGTTANAIGFGNQGFFSATPTASVPLLSINPSALFFNQVNVGSITSRSRLGLSVPTGQTLALIGGAITLDGSNLSALGGKIELGAIGSGSVDLDNSRFTLTIPDKTPLMDVVINNGSRLNVSAGEGGSLTVNARDITVSGGSRLEAGIAEGQGIVTSQAGNILLNATGRVSVAEQSHVDNGVSSGGFGVGGNIQINANSLLINDGARLKVFTFGQGNTGNIVINATDRVSFDGFALNASGDEGDASGTISFVDTNARGQGGDIRISAHSVSVTNAASIGTFSSGQGNAGNIQINARGLVHFDGATPIPENLSGHDATSNVISSVSGNARGGNLAISANSIEVTNGAELLNLTSGSNNAGRITLNARDRIVIDGVNPRRITPSFVRSEVNGGTGQSGDVRFVANSIAVTNGGQINTSTNGQGNAGNIVLEAGDRVLVARISPTLSRNGLAIRSEVVAGVKPEGRGEGGDLRIVTGSLLIRDGGRLDTSTLGRGDAGNVVIRSRDRVILDGFAQPGVHENEQYASSGISSVVLQEGKGGDIQISTDILSVTNGADLITGTLGLGDVGDVILNARSISFDGTLATTNSSSVATSAVFPGGQGQGGNIRIRANTLSLTHGARLFASTFSRGNAGTTLIDADRILLDGTSGDRRRLSSGIFANVIGEATGRGGDVQINVADSLTITNGAGIFVDTRGDGNAGDITINAGQGDVLLRGRGRSSVTGLFAGTLGTGQGEGGNITVRANDFRIADGATVNTFTRSNNSGGTVIVNSDTLEVAQGGQIITTTTSGGRAGSIRLQIRDRATFVGSDPREISQAALDEDDPRHEYLRGRSAASGLFADTIQSSTGRGGNINIATDQLSLGQGAQITATSRGEGQAGNIRVNAADSIQLSDRSRISVEANGSSTAGNLNLDTRQLTVQGRSRVTVRSLEGGAGNLTATAGTVVLDRGELSATTGVNRGKVGANISLNDLDSLLLRNRSEIQANANRSATGGNISIHSNFIVAVPIENSDITANARTGNGGRVNINTQGIFGITAQPRPTSQSDITAKSDQGVQGIVTINQPDVDPSRGLLELPTDVTDRSNQIDQSCPNQVRAGDQRGEFIVTGRSGLPANPSNPLTGDRPLADWVSLTPAEAPDTTAIPEKPPETAIVEAQGWVVGDRGEVKLVAADPSVPVSSVAPMPSCPQ